MSLVEDLREEKNAAYRERNMLVALVAKMAIERGWKAGIRAHDGDEWEDDWRNVIFIDLPSGQVSWHIHDSELHIFQHLVNYEKSWDGHTTREKYNRVLKYVERTISAPISHGKSVCLDLDGTLAKYDGWQGAENIGDPLPGAAEFVHKIQRLGYDVCIYSCRANYDNGKDAIHGWLIKHKFPLNVSIWKEKPPADIYIDDRGFRFSGDFEEALAAIGEQPWWKNKGAAAEHKVTMSEVAKVDDETIRGSMPSETERRHTELIDACREMRGNTSTARASGGGDIG